jgi:hypothetical protein
MLTQPQPPAVPMEGLVPRVERTLELMHRWGYAPTVDALASDLMGGPVSPSQLRDAIVDSGTLTLADPFVCLPGQENLLGKSRGRERTNRMANGHARSIGEKFARALARACPFVDSVTLAGSVASGGYVPSDDIDFDIFVRNGTKYLTYAVALALGFVFSLRDRTGGRLRKIICINVIWTANQVSPFARTDSDLAFELLHCRPLIGADLFQDILGRNEWIQRYFPQTGSERIMNLPRPRSSFLGKFLGVIADHPLLLGTAERVARTITFLVYRAVHWLRRKDRHAMERLAFLQQVKYPYEVFQD